MFIDSLSHVVPCHWAWQPGMLVLTRALYNKPETPSKAYNQMNNSYQSFKFTQDS